MVEDKPWLTEGWLVEGNGGIEMKTRLLTDVDQMWCRDTLAGTTIDLGWYGY